MPKAPHNEKSISKSALSQRPAVAAEDVENSDEPSEIESFQLSVGGEGSSEEEGSEDEELDDVTSSEEEAEDEEEEEDASVSRLLPKGGGAVVDADTQARLEALLEAAGIGKLAAGGIDQEGVQRKFGKELTDPEVLKRLTSSVSCALDEAAATLTRMRSEPQAHPLANTAADVDVGQQQQQLLDGRPVVEVCSESDINKVRKLLDEGRVSVDDTTEEGESLLSLACSAGYYELAQVLLAMRANIEDRGVKGDCTPLMEAASAGHVDIVKLLIAHGADVNAQSSSGNTPLMYACAGGHELVVRALLEAGANVEDHNENGHTPLMEAASAGHVPVAQTLLAFGAGINTHSNEFKESALTLACYKGHLEMVRFLLSAGADQEHKTDEMHTALMEASMDGHVEVARLLLDSGAQVNMPADSFESPLTLAACGGHVDLAMLLIERGANIEEVNDEGYTPLMEAAREGHEEMVALLLSQGAEINAQTEETQETALTLACCGGFFEVVDFLIKAGADIELGASTPLMEAAQEGHLDLVRYLIEAGALVNSHTGTGDTALTYACENGHSEVCDLLLKAGAALEHESEGGRTPLMKASRAGHLSTVVFLIERGANVNQATSNNDHTPLSLACAGGHQGVVEVLLQHGADPFHKLKDNSTMLIEAAKGGHANVVQTLIDYPNAYPNLVVQVDQQQQPPEQIQQPPQQLHQQQQQSNSKAQYDMVMQQQRKQAVKDAEVKVPKEQMLKNSGASVASAVGSNVGGGSAGPNGHLKSILRQTQPQSQQQALSPVATQQTNCSNKLEPVKESKIASGGESLSTEGYDFLEKSGFLIEGLAGKSLDAKSYIQSFLNRTENASREEQIQQKEQILAELQRVERELQEKAQAQSGRESGIVQCNPNTNAFLSTKEVIQNVANLSLADVKLQSVQQQQPPQQNQLAQQQQPTLQHASPTKLGQLSQRALANLPPSERPKAKPSRKIADPSKNGAKTKLVAPTPTNTSAIQLHAALQQQNQHLAHLQQLQQTNQQLQQQVMQQRQLKNQAALAALQQNALANQQQLAALQQNVAQLQQLEQHILQQQTTSNDPAKGGANSQQQQQYHHNLLQAKVQQMLAEKQQLEQKMKNFQAQVEQHLAYPQQQATGSAQLNQQKRKTSNNDDSRDTQDLVADRVQSKESFADIEPLTQDPALLSSVHAPHCPVSVDMANQAIMSGFKEGLQEVAGATSGLSLGYAPNAGSSEDRPGDVIDFQQALNDASHQLLLQAPQIQLPAFPGQFNLGAADFNYVQQTTAVVSVSGGGTGGTAGEANFLPIAPGAQQLRGNEVTTGVVDLPPGTPMKQPELKKDAKTKALTKVAKKSRDKTTTETNETCDASACTGTMTSAPWVDLDSETESNHDTALTLACAGGHEDLVKLLLDRGADIEHRDKKGFTPLILAATAGHEKVVEILIDHNADIEAQSERTKDTPLSLACSGGRYEVVDILLSRGANKEHRNVSDYTPLSLAASGGYVNIIKLLLAHGAEINSRTGSKLGISPLMLAAMNGHTPAVKLLLDMGSDINAQIETNRNTALTLACFQGRHEVVSLLLDRKANVEHRAKTGLTPLMEAASGGYVDVGRVLLDKGADVNAPPVPSSRDTALTIAADKGHYRFVELLLSRKAQVDVRNKKGNSSLWLAANGGHLDVVQLLFSAGADIDSTDNRKVSCLMAAFRKGHSKVVKWMVKNVTQFPSETELSRFVQTIAVGDKELIKKCQSCNEIIRVAKDRQAAEAAKNASILLEELDRESKLEQSKKEAAARKREKKKRKKMEKKGVNATNEKQENTDKGSLQDDDEDDNDDIEEEMEEVDQLALLHESKEKSPSRKITTVELVPEPASKSKTVAKEEKKKDKKTATVQSPVTNKESLVKTTKNSAAKQSSARAPEEDKNEEQRQRDRNSDQRVPETIIPIPKGSDNNSTAATTALLSTDNTGVQRTPQQQHQQQKRGQHRSGRISGEKNDATSPKKGNNSSSSKNANTANVDPGWKEVIRKSKKVSVPANAISRVIGRGGCNINAIREMSGAHIEVEKQQGSKGGADRAIVIKGSAEATRQANSWIQAVISNPDKDLVDIIGKPLVPSVSGLPAVAPAPSIAKVPIVNIAPTATNKSSSSVVTSNSKAISSNNGANTKSSVNVNKEPNNTNGRKGQNIAPLSGTNKSKQIIAKTGSSLSCLPSATGGNNGSKSNITSFAAVASGGSSGNGGHSSPWSAGEMSSNIGNNNIGMIATVGPPPTNQIASSSNSSSKPLFSKAVVSSRSNDSNIGSEDVSTNGLMTPASGWGSGGATDEPKDYSPFKYNVVWNGNNKEQLIPPTNVFKTEQQDVPQPLPDMSKAPGYRGTSKSSVGPGSSWGVPLEQRPSPPHPVLMDSFQQQQQPEQERCSSAPGISNEVSLQVTHNYMQPQQPQAPIGPPSRNKTANLTSPVGSEPEVTSNGKLAFGNARPMTPDAVELENLRSNVIGGIGNNGPIARPGSSTSRPSSASTAFFDSQHPPPSVLSMQTSAATKTAAPGLIGITDSLLANQQQQRMLSKAPGTGVATTTYIGSNGQVAQTSAPSSAYLPVSGTDRLMRSSVGIPPVVANQPPPLPPNSSKSSFDYAFNQGPVVTSGANVIGQPPPNLRGPYQQQQHPMMNKLNPNAPDFLRIQTPNADYLYPSAMGGGVVNRSGVIAPPSKAFSNNGQQHSVFNNNSMMGSRLPQGMPGFPGMNDYGIPRPKPPQNPPYMYNSGGGELNLDMISGRSLREITDMLGGMSSGVENNNAEFGLDHHLMHAPPPSHKSSAKVISRPIGSERRQVSQQPGTTKTPNMWDSMWEQQDPLIANGSNAATAFPPSLSGQTLDTLIKQQQQDVDYFGDLTSSAMNMTQKSEFMTDFMASKKQPGAMPPTQPPPAFPSTVDAARKNFMWTKKWED